jgi:hypothetical protein
VSKEWQRFDGAQLVSIVRQNPSDPPLPIALESTRPAFEDDDAEARADVPEDWRDAAHTTRAVVKWIVASFAAVGAALLAALPLTDVTDIAGAPAALLAISGGLLAFGGTVVGVWSASDVLVPRLMTLGAASRDKEVRAAVAVDPATMVAGIGASIDEFITDFEGWRRTVQQLARLKGEDNVAERQRRLAVDAAALAFRTSVAARLVELAHVQSQVSAFRSGRLKMLGGFASVAAGVGLFIAAISLSDETEQAVSLSNVPQAMLWSMSASAKDELGSSIGARCDTTAVPVFAVVDSWMIVRGSASCESLFVKCNPSWAHCFADSPYE